jgi:hypothetical protein
MSARRQEIDPVVIAWDRFQAVERSGLATSRARREWDASMQAMAATRSATLMGVLLKLKLIELELRDGKSSFGESILTSAIADLSRFRRRNQRKTTGQGAK